MLLPSWASSPSSIRALTPSRIRAVLWMTGLLALLGATVGWALPARPYEAPWAWISFIGMCIVDDFVLGSSAEATWGELPKVALFAAIIDIQRSRCSSRSPLRRCRARSKVRARRRG